VRRVLFSPSWWLRHALAAGISFFFVKMGVWQWTKGESGHGGLQNLFYGVEWLVFTAFVVYLWGKMVKEEVRPGPAAPATSPAPDGLTTSATGSATALTDLHAAMLVGVGGMNAASLAAERDPDDPEDPADADLSAYNEYLAALHDRDRR
jgi:hypothetical protein